MEIRPETVAAPEQSTQLVAGRSELTCILFPGIVRNHERAIQCLGGIREISTVYSEPTKRRLSLTFNPENPYAKKTFADLSETSGLLIRVRWRRRRAAPGAPAGPRELLSTDIVGDIRKIYKFQSMLDFALLPAPLLSAPGGARCLLHQLVPSGVETFSWLQGPAPYFIVPTHFTRSDKPFDYRYSDKTLVKVHNEIAAADHDHHHRLRANRLSHVIQLQFSLAEALPTAPPPGALRALSARIAAAPAVAADLELVRKMFEDRPIWSKNALRYFTKISNMSLKLILPSVALYYRGGPWRQLWVRFGYDPRAHRDALRYQTLDFRMKNFNARSGKMVPPVRLQVHKKLARPNEQRRRRARRDASDAVAAGVPVTAAAATTAAATAAAATAAAATTAASDAAEVPEAAVVFRAGLTPYQRQIFYQFCDLKLPEVEETLARLCGAGAEGGACHARRGWLPAGLHERVRTTLDLHARRSMRATSVHCGDEEEGWAEGEAGESGGEQGAGSGGGDDSDAEYVLPDMLDDFTT